MKERWKEAIRRITAAVLVLALTLCDLPLCGGTADGTVNAEETDNTGSTWGSWEELYFSMRAAQIEGTDNDGISDLLGIMESRLTTAYDESGDVSETADADAYWSRLVNVMESLDFGDETDYEKAYAVYRWIRTNVSYGASCVSGSSYGALMDGKAVCSGYSKLFSIMCAYVGLETMSVVSVKEGNHEFNMVKVDGGWYFVDATNGRFLQGSHEWFMNSGAGALPGGPYSYATSLANEYCYGYYQTSCNGEHGKFASAAGSGSNRYETYKLYVCEDCGYEIFLINTECTDGTGHNYTKEITAPDEGYCGYTKYTCETCGKVYYDNFTAPLGHDWTEVTVEPTCTERGYTYTYCAGCDSYRLYNADGTAEYDDTGTVNGYTDNGCANHTDDYYGTIYTDTDGTEYSTRYNYTPAAGHSWDDGTVTTEPTATSAGTMTYTCTECGKTRTEEIAATGGDLADAQITLSCDIYAYDGTFHRPSVTVTYEGETVPQVVSGSASEYNYTVTYSSYKNPGTATVTVAAADGSVWTGSQSVTFTITKGMATVTASVDSVSILAGSTAQVTASATGDTTGDSLTVAYRSSDETVATVSSSGLVTGVAEGTAVITVYTSASNAYYEQAEASVAITVADPDKTDISGAEVVLEEAEYVYDGTAHEPGVVSVTLADGTVLDAGTDYTVAYADNTDTGTAKVTVTGCGYYYTGAALAEFTIEPYDLANGTIMTNGTCYYDGTEKEPNVYVYYSGRSNRLTEGTDYTLEFSDNINAGTATVTAAGCGNYTGTISGNFTVVRRSINTAEVSAADCTYTATALEPDVTVALDGVTLTAGTDYTVSYSGNTAVGTASFTVKGCGNYTGSSAGEFTITQADIADVTVTLSDDTFTYDGTAHEPEVTVEFNGQTLLSIYYTVSYSDNVDAGTATVTLTGKFNFTGTKTVEYTIKKADQTVTTGADSVAVAEGGSVTLTASSTGDGNISWLSTDISIAEVYGGTVTGVSAGTVTVIATAAGTDNYNEGYAAVTVTVAEPVDISGAEILLSRDSYTYDGTAHEPEITVTLDGTVLAEGTDYTAAYSDNTGVGTATVTVTGCGTYTGTATAEYTISRAAQNLSAGAVSVAAGSTAAVPVSGTKTRLSYVSSDTSVVTVNNSGVITGVSAGTATVTATAEETGQYSGASVTVNVTVYRSTQKISVASANVSLVAGKTSAISVSGAKTAVAYASSDTSVATVSSTGVVTAVSAGTAVITVTAAQTGQYYAASATVAVTVTRSTQGMTVSSPSVSIAAGKTSAISVSGAKTAVTYASSDTSVATVSSTGVITAVSAGTAVITVTAAQTGQYYATSAAVAVTVTRNTQTITASPSSVSLVNGGTGTLSVSGAKTTLSYVSSNTSVAAVDGTGKITAKGVGTATITVTAAQTGQYTGTTSAVTVTVKPAAPAISSVKNTTSGVKVTWGKVSGATKYYVYRKAGSSGWLKVKTVSSGSTVSWTDKSVSSGKTYYYKVYAYASTGRSTASAAKSVKYLAPGKISSLTNVSSGITVKWSNVAGASGYYVYRKAASGSYKKVANVGKSTTSWTDTAVKSKNGTTYYYCVKAYSGSTTGSYTGKKTVRLTAVALSSVTNSASKALTVKIKAGNSKATGYQIQYSTSSTFASGNKTVKITSASTLSKKVTGLTKGKTYYVRVRAYKTVNGKTYYSAWSSKKSVKISK